MTLRPHEDQKRFFAITRNEPLKSQFCAVCHAYGTERHHIFREVQGIRRPAWVVDTKLDIRFCNIMPLCRHCHHDVTGGVGGHRAFIHYDDDSDPPVWLWVNAETREVVAEVDLLTAGTLSEGEDKGVLGGNSDAPESSGAPTTRTTPSESVPPGHKCPTCERKMPHPRKPASPSSKVKGTRIPTDEYKAYVENLEAAQKIVGVYEQKFADFKTHTVGLMLILQQADEVREWLKRRPAA